MLEPWKEEPNHLEFKSNGFPCMIHRNHMGALCGYVGVPPTHLWYKKNYDDVEADVHGGLTYSNKCQGEICHVAEPGEDDIWWLGFDCAHAGDFSPKMGELMNRGPNEKYESYKDINYVKEEIRQLSEQALAAQTEI